MPAETPAARGPDVRVPPPFFFLAGWLLAWAAHRSWPWPIDAGAAGLAQELAGAGLLAAGLGLMLWAGAMMLGADTPIVPIRPARALVARGPFRFSRNPMYVGMTAGYLGLALMLNRAWPILMLPLVLVALGLIVIRREERHLRLMFGDDYRAYCQRVRRWL